MAEPFIEEKTRKVALLIDGDNAQPSLIEQDPDRGRQVRPR